MDHHLIWLMAGFILVIMELATTTFYLLVLAIAAFAAAGVAYAGSGIAAQAIVAALVAAAGVFWVNQHRKRAMPKQMRGIDVGQPACFDSWVNRSAGHARVKYRDALWDAHVAGEAAGEPGEILYVNSVDGNTLKVSKARPA
jgi:membrane protein implicated in regulation of membrane protease activity